MPQASKGELTRNKILRDTNEFFNKNGINSTITEIGQQTGLGKSKITNYFPKKEILFKAILEEYNEKAQHLFLQYHQGDIQFSFSWYVSYISKVMDLMYEYRAVINFSLVEDNNFEVNQHIRESYLKNKKVIHQRIEFMVNQGLIDSSLLDQSEFNVFVLQYYSVASFWINIFQRVESERSYFESKPDYLKAILACFNPYLTKKGKEEKSKAVEEFFAQEEA
ncbi:TetR/AcrR family transcriptional regulator [uncultured Algoriphagus sp.]|uniref:TetR/AcrR family transcriptional regulator n=1 Tax=uncultured Algoriphagus sp. TaxID=417365 RepID=UPI002590096F|nr:TetR/AcrR family transcriptional regulator [uncultured Algoriphagus sp.]